MGGQQKAEDDVIMGAEGDLKMLLALKIDRVALMQGMQLQGLKGTGDGFFPRASGGSTTLLTPWFGPVHLISDFWPLELLSK